MTQEHGPWAQLRCLFLAENEAVEEPKTRVA